MNIKINVAEDSVVSDTEYNVDPFEEGKQFPAVTVGRSSYIGELYANVVFDEYTIYNFHVGRYCSLAADIGIYVDLNHDYKKVSQGRILGVPYVRPTRISRKGQVIIMNDCWIGQKANIMSGVTVGNGAVVAAGALVTKDVPPYAIVAGNPAKIIGYRFEEDVIEKLNLIRWWNWSAQKVIDNAPLLYGDVKEFVAKHIDAALDELKNIPVLDIQPIPKTNKGEEKIFLCIPDFEQDYPTYPRVIRSFVESYSDTNYELLLYIREDEFLDDKLALLDKIFSDYEDANCYINLYIGNIEDERALFGQVDAYITNRSKDNVVHIDMAQLFGIPCISGVDLPVFDCDKLAHMVKANPKNDLNGDAILNRLASVENMSTSSFNMIKKLADSVSKQGKGIEQLSWNQIGLNSTFDNLKYELNANKESLRYPIIKDGQKAIDLIINEGKSLCRFGDGEFSIIQGIDRQKFQHCDDKLAGRLLEVLHQTDDNILIGIADNYGDLSKYNSDGKYNIRAYLTEETREKHYDMLDMEREYYDAYMTRPYAIYADNNTEAPRKRFDVLKKIWEGRRLLIIEGEKTRMGVGNDLFDNAADIVRILGPAEHAFDRYDEIINKALEQDKDRLVLIAMGPTATVLAYDLAKAGYQALDIGHVDLEYEWMLEGKGRKTIISHKYTNELIGGEIVTDIRDKKYDDQIIARIY